ncbi:MAG: 4-hydroxy-3-methylbut-2-enyl diphosphate reductase [Candidatus Omnitrophica bacterium]|jgi:4-hydroxy-3-methylbut-2-enyl diphosphate reductase|nr:4-hydroxy-3-methylbut-2-enyl diphosphate reductase [Candidatus Omnitrophota bacterium]
MKISLAKSAGFCFGVKRAITLALETAKGHRQVYMLGDIVHNEKVVQQVKEAGIKKIKRLTCGKDKILLIRAHGNAIKITNQGKKLGYKIIDATCPMVKEIHKIARNAHSRGLNLIVIGDKKHDEVLGIIGQVNTRAIVIDRLKNIPESLKNIKKAAVVVQSTQNFNKVAEIINQLKKIIPGLEFHNTICQPTRIKQEEIRGIPLKNDLMLIIGSKNSANTQRLYEISKSLNPKSYWVNSVRGIKKGWFKGIQKVGITAGASTPESTIQEIIKYLLSFPSS